MPENIFEDNFDFGKTDNSVRFFKPKKNKKVKKMLKRMRKYERKLNRLFEAETNRQPKNEFAELIVVQLISIVPKVLDVIFGFLINTTSKKYRNRRYLPN